MKSLAENSFNIEYAQMRSYVLQGICHKEDAKLWLQARSQRLYKELLHESKAKMYQHYSGNVEREMAALDKLFGKLGGEDV